MKLSADLLRNITLGIGLSATLASCSALKDEPVSKSECDEECTKENCKGNCYDESQTTTYNCPACGMG